jgi:RNA polymerase sigma-70 factor (ECF subfamily)
MFFLRNREDAEDVVQAALLKTHVHLSQYHGEAEFATWLLRIVSNECLMLLRQKRRARFLYLDDKSRESEAPRLELSSCGSDPEHEMACGELKHVLSTEIRHLPPLLRNVIVLRDIQGFPMTDVAERLQITVPAAKSRLARARIELRLRLRRHCGDIGTFSLLLRSGIPHNRVPRRMRMNRLPVTAR